MFSRRPGHRFNRGRIATGGGASAPAPPTTSWLTILGSAAWWVRSDLLVTQSGGTVSAWGDSSGNGVNFSPITGQPTYNATGLDGKPTIRGNNTDKGFVATFSRAAPATQPFYVRFLARLNTWTVNKYLWGDGGAAIYLNAVSPQVRAFNGTNGTVISVTVGTWYRISAQFTAANTCIFRIGSATNTSATGASASGATVGLLANPGGSLFSDWEIAQACHFVGTPTAGMLTDLDALDLADYPSVTF